MAQEPEEEEEEEDCTEAEKDMIISDMIRTLLYDDGYDDTGDNTLTPRGVLHYEANKTTGVTKLPSASRAAPSASKPSRATKPASKPATELKSVIYETVKLEIFREVNGSMLPSGVISSNAKVCRIPVKGTGGSVLIPIGKLRRLLQDNARDTVFEVENGKEVIYVVMRLDRQLLLDAAVEPYR